MRNKYFLLFLILFTSFVFSGCSVLIAAHQPDYKDLRFLKKGVSRTDIILKIGHPLKTETDSQGLKVDYYQFRQGYSMGNKVSRMLFHGTADVFTLGLWEVVGTPSEVICNGHEVTIKVTYDSKEIADKILFLKSKN